MNNNTIRLLLLILIVGSVSLFFSTGIGEHLTLSGLKKNLPALHDHYAKHTVETALIYGGIYILVTALSLPGAAVLTLAGGALFGFAAGTTIVSFASSIGATLAFLASRFLLRDFVNRKFGDKLASVNKGIERDGAFYLFTLRLVPLFPFFAINLLMGLTSVRTVTFYWVSQAGMILGTMAYVNAGMQISRIDSLKDILSPTLLLSFALLGILPILSKKTVDFLSARKVYRNYKKPKTFDYNMIVIGAGAGGLVTSYIAAAVNAKVALIEKDRMGGDCLNTGCVPSKALIKSAKILHSAQKAEEFGLRKIEVDFEFHEVMERVHRVIKRVEPHDSRERYTSLGVDCLEGKATIVSPWEVELEGRILTAKTIVIAAGASPFVPPIPGIEEIDYITSDTLWKMRDLPKRLLVVGGGPIGLEMAQSFNRFGSEVTVVESAPCLMGKEDDDVSCYIREHLTKEGISLLTGHRAEEFLIEEERQTLVCSREDGVKVRIGFDTVLLSVGRKANTKGYGLEELGIVLRKNGTIETNEYLQTNFPNILACGDITGPYQLTHMAAHQAWFCAVNGLFGTFKKFKVDYSVVSWVTYTDPEVATVGLNEMTAKERNIPYEITKYHLDDLDRAIAEGEETGFVKVLTVPGKDKILGATIVGSRAGEMLLEFIAAMKHGFGLNKILGSIHPYPTMGEANKYLAGAWKKERKPEKVLTYLRKFHTFRRGGVK